MMLTPDSPCEGNVMHHPDGGVTVDIFVPTYSGGQRFVLSTQRDGDGGWRVYLPCWPDEIDLVDPCVVVEVGGNTIDVASGIAYLGAPDVPVERL